MLSTSDPGGGSCRAMVSDVSMVKYTSMGHSFFSGGGHAKRLFKTSEDSLNACKSAVWNVPCHVTTTCWHNSMLEFQSHGTYSSTLSSGRESGLQKEDRSRRPLTPASSSSPVWHIQARDTHNLLVYFLKCWECIRYEIQEKHWTRKGNLRSKSRNQQHCNSRLLWRGLIIWNCVIIPHAVWLSPSSVSWWPKK